MTVEAEFQPDPPPVLVEDFSSLRPGSARRFALMEYVSGGGAAPFGVEYLHGHIEYRSPGQKDAVAHGTARLVDGGEFRPVRILFSRYHQTATLKGLELEGRISLT